ncbi:MAG: response regulator [Acidobacteriota bacterium]|nr:response regulator [Acidobacteriota bacterium]
MLEELKGSETLLVADDEPVVLSLARAILARYGYQVFLAADGAEALRICRDKHKTIDLLLTDVIMPRMSGLELAHCVKELNGAMRCIFMSGYDYDQIRNHGGGNLNCDYLRKPFTPEALLRKVRETLDAPKANSN